MSSPDRSLRARLRHRAVTTTAGAVERLSLPLDRRLARRTRVLDRIPRVADRRGGKQAYGEWAWVAGMFGALIADLVDGVPEPRIVDVGCGPGLVLVAAEPTVLEGGELIGLDVQASEIDFCRRHYPDPPYRFDRIDRAHPVYAPDAGPSTDRWPVEDASADLVTALSVLTHLDGAEAAATLSEMARILRPGRTALVSAFLVDLEVSGDRAGTAGSPPPPSAPDTSRFHHTPPTRWRFERSLGDGFFAPAWADPPERAIGLTQARFSELAAEVGLEIRRIRPGTWRERRGLYFQDLVELRRPNDRG